MIISNSKPDNKFEIARSPELRGESFVSQVVALCTRRVDDAYRVLEAHPDVVGGQHDLIVQAAQQEAATQPPVPEIEFKEEALPDNVLFEVPDPNAPSLESAREAVNRSAQ